MPSAGLQPDAATLLALLEAARERTLDYAARVPDSQWLGPYLKIVNPPLWELGHVAWFQEHWCLRYRPDDTRGGTLAKPMMANADALYNSAIVPHVERWKLPLPAPDQTLRYLRDVLDAVRARIEREGATEHLRYFAQLALFHEEMHNEAFDYTCQTLGYAEKNTQLKQIVTDDLLTGDAAVAGGRFVLGAAPENGFVFDNEKWGHEVEVRPFYMARTAVTYGEFAAFVDDGGYTRRDLWCDDGWRWREAVNATAPLYWQKQGGDWCIKRFDQWSPMEANAAVIHVNWFEASAYCRWAKRRLPAEAEWEFAAATAPGSVLHKRRYPWGDALPTPAHANLYGGAGRTVNVNAHAAGDSAWGVRQLFGNAWEWTADWFNAYPSFVRDPYKEYSEPWFGNHKVLRGGCHATRACLLRNTWRNFYTPDRRDVLAGFRTCALD